MKPLQPFQRGIVALASVILMGCQLASPDRVAVGEPDFVIDRQAFVARLAHPEAADWSVSRITTPEADRLRAMKPTGASQRRLQAVSDVWNATSTSLGGTGRISSAPGFHYMTNQAFWITDDGWLLRRNMVTGATATFRISATDTFPRTAVTLSADARRIYLTSLQGNFFAIDTSTGTNIAGSPVAMSGTNGNVPVALPPFIDALASRPDGQRETVYALTHTGTLYRFVVGAPKDGTPTLTMAQTYTNLGMDNTAPYTELCHSSPLVIRGKAVIGTWHRHATDATMHKGNLIYYDTGATTTSTASTTGSPIRKVGLAAPVWAPPAIDVDDSFTPMYAFAPTGYVVSMVELATGDRAESPPLLVNQTSPVSGVLAGYDYGTSGISTVTKTPTTAATTIAGAAGLAVGKDTSNFYATDRFNDSVATPYYGYLKFYVAQSDTVVGGTQRAILDAEVRLRCNSSSNRNGNSNPAPDPLRAFLVSNNLSTGGAWDSAAMTVTNRPTFEDGAAFTEANLASHTAVELLPNAGNAFRNAQDYDWSAKGKVAATDTFYSFGFAHTSAAYENTGGSNGQPFRDSAPRFDGGTAPDLILTLSGEGLSNPTMSNPVSIDAARKRIFVASTNALFTVSYRSQTYDAASTPYDALSWGERKNNFGDPFQAFFCLTTLGQDGTASPITLTTTPRRYVDLLTAPLFNGVDVYVQDYHPIANRVTINRFSPGTAVSNTSIGTAPTRTESISLTGLAADAQAPATYLSYDYRGANLYAGTYNPTSTTGRAWVLTQQ